MSTNEENPKEPIEETPMAQKYFKPELNDLCSSMFAHIRTTHKMEHDQIAEIFGRCIEQVDAVLDKEMTDMCYDSRLCFLQLYFERQLEVFETRLAKAILMKTPNSKN